MISRLCKKFDIHSYINITQPVSEISEYGRVTRVTHHDYYRYCKHCMKLFLSKQQIAGAEVLDHDEEIDYSNLVGHLVQDPYNLEVEDLTMISMIHPELYDYCKLWLKKS